MFDLDQSIAEWRKQMLAVGIKAPVPLEELEIHLRDEIERQMKSGMDAQKAFEMTVSQIGQAKELKIEFSKDKRLRDILEIELIKKECDLKWGPILHFVIFTGILAFVGSALFFKKGSFSETTSLERMSSFAAIVVSYLLFNGGLLGWKFFPVIVSHRMRLTIYACAAMLVSFGLMILLVSVNIDVHQFLARFLWVFLVPLGAFSGLVLGLERAAQKKIGAAGS